MRFQPKEPLFSPRIIPLTDEESRYVLKTVSWRGILFFAWPKDNNELTCVYNFHLDQLCFLF